jgi:hypothetical protein
LVVFTCCSECDGAQEAIATVANTTAAGMFANKNREDMTIS